MTEETEFIFTFPVSDAERRECFMRVRSHDETDARLKVIARYSRTGFGSCYWSEEDAGVAYYGLREIEFGS